MKRQKQQNLAAVAQQQNKKRKHYPQKDFASNQTLDVG